MNWDNVCDLLMSSPVGFEVVVKGPIKELADKLPSGPRLIRHGAHALSIDVVAFWSKPGSTDASFRIVVKDRMDFSDMYAGRITDLRAHLASVLGLKSYADGNYLLRESETAEADAAKGVLRADARLGAVRCLINECRHDA